MLQYIFSFFRKSTDNYHHFCRYSVDHPSNVLFFRIMWIKCATSMLSTVIENSSLCVTIRSF